MRFAVWSLASSAALIVPDDETRRPNPAFCWSGPWRQQRFCDHNVTKPVGANMKNTGEASNYPSVRRGLSPDAFLWWAPSTRSKRAKRKTPEESHASSSSPSSSSTLTCSLNGATLTRPALSRGAPCWSLTSGQRLGPGLPPDAPQVRITERRESAPSWREAEQFHRWVAAPFVSGVNIKM